MQQRVKHANTLHVLAISLDPLAFVLEFLPHTLYDVVLDWEKDISWPLRLKIALELAQALHHMHCTVGIGRAVDLDPISSEAAHCAPGPQVAQCDALFARSNCSGTTGTLLPASLALT